MRKLLFITLLTAVTVGCQQAKKSVPVDVSSSVEKLMSVDDIYKIEHVLADSSLMDAKGDTAWRRINDKLIRVKIGNNCYLRQETEDGTVTAFTYGYE